MEASDSHILLIPSAKHTGMLQDRIHLEFLWITPIEEAYHLPNCDSSV